MILSVNNNNEICLTVDDFVFLVEKYMGNESKRYIERMLDKHASELEEYENECEQLCEQLDLLAECCSNSEEGD